MVKNYPGKPTYKRDNVIIIFEGDKHFDKIYSKIENDVKSYASSEFNFGKKYGLPGDRNVILSIVNFQEDVRINVDKYSDGWHISLKTPLNRKMFADKLDKVFGDRSMDSIWTQETNKVSKLVIDILKELKIK